MLLSIITITKDDPTGLQRTLKSAQAMRAAGVEQIVVDGSGDPSIARALIERNGFVGITLAPRAPSGISAAFNAGLKDARGRWVWFLNGGDAVHENLEVGWLLSLLEMTGSDVVTGTLHFDGEPSPRSTPPLHYQWPLIACWISHPATIVRRQLLVDSGGFDSRWRIAMDYDLWFRILKRNAVMDVLSIPLARFDVNGLSENRRTSKISEGEAATVVLRHSALLLAGSVWIFLRVVKRLGVAFVQSLLRGRRRNL